MLEKLIEIIHNYTGDESVVIDESTSLMGDLGLNSMDLVSMASEVEDEFGVEIPDRVLWEIKTVGDVIRFIPKE
jgi:acyl carrier protein